jgi:hypothetical protein
MLGKLVALCDRTAPAMPTEAEVMQALGAAYRPNAAVVNSYIVTRLLPAR